MYRNYNYNAWSYYMELILVGIGLIIDLLFVWKLLTQEA